MSFAVAAAASNASATMVKLRYPRCASEVCAQSASQVVLAGRAASPSGGCGDVAVGFFRVAVSPGVLAVADLSTNQSTDRSWPVGRATCRRPHVRVATAPAALERRVDSDADEH